ncbi:cytochrome c maturation protein CcmE [Pseudonocardia sp. KRD-184]|uniref:Cytochrome c maturation protein CcmE n=1 Tax=Pseudonocardia oceani TaxID=2792013 RepID=A0ABS6U2N1_9PSEU|nr:cytochrome c maturation protein CcmE [Pseudonocardia oceani]MBW0092467.1 cytochrome c maturation protein CcmE [Pseudonocardia oceani]MBW0097103.1 cytochrome c maturation protein CcmE [Pseudonocardia oceani]MBW0121944.1 cytochrome c maturation protein CcmE [Pseudonocardia oceani]MBW0126502.1 cytochrome c maturation protein CcmE [Pseudonocardia oceani]
MTASGTAPRGVVNRYRLLALVALGAVAVLVGMLVFGNLNRNLVYYLTPDEAVARQADYPDGRRFQLGGLVVEGSVATIPQGVSFTVSSDIGPAGVEVPVIFEGAPAQLFGSGIGVVLEGSWRAGTFTSDTMKVKHDENYRPAEQGTT